MHVGRSRSHPFLVIETRLVAFDSLMDGGDDPGPSPVGPWSSSSMHIAGNGPAANFGVALRNGYAEAWAHEIRPTTTLARNRGLSGQATWEGTLVGLTPSA